MLKWYYSIKNLPYVVLNRPHIPEFKRPEAGSSMNMALNTRVSDPFKVRESLHFSALMTVRNCHFSGRLDSLGVNIVQDDGGEQVEINQWKCHPIASLV